ncbi:unnamed protein product [Spirodela intermedia]|uniref:Uncharacterized protein n=1 Tax=Spirodela intermedia TaxID=51605 RepID=A0A7I8JQ96_SPIIN|nr:unnamed protein product [Spirodela intermedia]CAA6671931.1 unnamed protein product [Spirodela intermedia]
MDFIASLRPNLYSFLCDFSFNSCLILFLFLFFG